MKSAVKKYQAYYTKSTPIVDYMVKKLSILPNDIILEPCGGDGVFVDAIINTNQFSRIDICELNPESVSVLNSKFSHLPNIQIRECDTLLDSQLNFNSRFGGYYDKIIANPPYGAWQDSAKKVILKRLYPNLYVKESYGLFLYRCIELLKDNGVLTFIIPDTFLNLHMHKAIRKHILENTQIISLALFPSSFFPGVNFGYANLSIITLRKNSILKECLNHKFTISSGFKVVDQLMHEYDKNLKRFTYTQNEIFNNPDHAFLLAENNQVCKLINQSKLKIGDIAHCVTGFYSGDDKKFLKVLNPDLKNGKNYDLINPESINTDYKRNPEILDGIDGDNCFLPILKGGNTKFLKPDCWFMNWSKGAVKHYKTDKKARFQNPGFYFKFGIGVPMISSTSITAALIENKLFDQSIVGIFPKDEYLTFYLLAFFNSPTCNRLIRTINPSANNPANYIKKIPVIIPERSEIDQITCKTKEIIDSINQSGNYDKSLETKVWNLIENIYNL